MEVNRRPSEVLEEQEIEQAIQSLHTQAEALRNELEIQEVLNIMRLGLRAKFHAIHRGDTNLREQAEAFCEFLLRYTTLLECFRESPGHRVSGPRGAAERLGISDAAVYARFYAMGILPRDVTRANDIGLKMMVEKEPLKSRIRALEEAMSVYEQVDDGQHEIRGHTESV